MSNSVNLFQLIGVAIIS